MGKGKMDNDEAEASTPIDRLLYEPQDDGGQNVYMHMAEPVSQQQSTPSSSSVIDFLNSLNAATIVLLLVAFVAGLLVSRVLQNNVIIKA